MQRALAEQSHHLREQALRQVGPLVHQLIGIDAEVADVVAERAQADAGVLVEVALAQFQEAAKGLEHPQVAVDGFARQRVQHHVDPAAISVSQNFIGVGQGPRIIDVTHAQQAQQVALFVRAGGGVDFRAQPLRELDGGNAHAASRAVDQDLLAFFQARQVVQRVVDGEEGAGDGGGGLKREAVRNVRDGAGLGQHAVAKAGGAKAHDGVTDGIAGHVRTHADDGARKLQAKRGAGKAVFDGFVGQQAQCVHDVAEVQTGGFDADFKLVVARSRGGAGFPAQVA
ncbi:hypothetical protein D3C71_1266890 [compost metagenome]